MLKKMQRFSLFLLQWMLNLNYKIIKSLERKNCWNARREKKVELKCFRHFFAHTIFLKARQLHIIIMCDVIKIRLKRKDERRGGKGNPKKEIDLDVFLWWQTWHSTYLQKIGKYHFYDLPSIKEFQRYV